MSSLLERLRYTINDIFGKRPMRNHKEISIRRW